MFFNDFWWFLLWSFYFIAYLYVVIVIITDLFRDDALNGWLKALWIIALVFLPFLTALVYIIARGKGMAQRAQASRGGVVAEYDEYRPAASSSPAEDIAKAKREKRMPRHEASPLLLFLRAGVGQLIFRR